MWIIDVVMKVDILDKDCEKYYENYGQSSMSYILNILAVFVLRLPTYLLRQFEFTLVLGW